LLALGLLLCLAHPAAAASIDRAQTFYDDAKRGWFWYETTPTPAPEKPADTAPGLAAVFIPDMQNYSTEQLWKMHPDQFKALLQAFQKKAIMEPSVANLRDYMTMQDIARRKAAEFAMVTNYTLQASPEFDLNRDYPLATPGRTARTRLQQEEVQSRLAAAGKDHALLYFYSPSCAYCQEQDGILRYFVERHGWEIKPIDIEAQPGLAARFNVRTTPSMLLIQRGNDSYLPATVGVVSLDTLEDRLFRGVRLLSGEISPQEYAMYDFQRGGTMDPQSILRPPVRQEAP
jgi:conjugal transfer pilus assembly protein TraF